MNQVSKPPLTVVELLQRRAANQPQQRAYVYLAGGEREVAALTYQALDRQARAIAAGLRQRQTSGERALLLYPAGLEFIAAFFGCLYAGVAAVPAYLPPFKPAALDRLEAIAADAQAKIALTTEETLLKTRSRLTNLPALQALTWLASKKLAAEAGPDPCPPASPAGEQVAFLQYTSGSTGAPKGVMISHDNLRHNLAVIHRAFDIDGRGGCVSWLPMYHDMGLVGGILGSLHGGIPAVVMSPRAFSERPARWLEAISRYGAAISGAPNFAYELCLTKISPAQRAGLDLSRWRTAFCGAEPVRADTLARFSQTFAACGFRPEAFHPCYGLAETTLMASGGENSRPPRLYAVNKRLLRDNQVVETRPESDQALVLVGCGRAGSDHDMLVVDPAALTRCPPGRVGEIWLAGPSVAQGYWNRPQETTTVFQAYLANGTGPFLRTGDSGFMRNGEVFLTGRLKDLIIIRGQNYAPAAIEHTAETGHPALQPGGSVAFGVEVEGREQLVIGVEVKRRHRHVEVEAVAAAVRGAVAQTWELETYAVAVVKPGSLPRTTSGKIRRQLCRDQFLADRLPLLGCSRRSREQPPLSRPPAAAETAGETDQGRPRTQVEKTVRTRLAEILNIPPAQVDFQTSLQNLGLGSLQAAALKYQLEEQFNLELSPQLFLEDITLQHFVTTITQEPERHDALPEDSETL